MMLQSCYAVFATSILDSVSFHCFLAHVELEKELFASWNQVLWPCKAGKKQIKQPASWMDYLTRKNKIRGKIIPSHIRKTATGF